MQRITQLVFQQRHIQGLPSTLPRLRVAHMMAACQLTMNLSNTTSYTIQALQLLPNRRYNSSPLSASMVSQSQGNYHTKSIDIHPSENGPTQYPLGGQSIRHVAQIHQNGCHVRQGAQGTQAICIQAQHTCTQYQVAHIERAQY